MAITESVQEARSAAETAAARSGGSAIEVRGLTVRYGDVTAVRELDLDVADGEMLVLLGPSGCGKTSTMRSIVGLETPVAGSIRVGDRTLFDAESGIDVPPNRRDMGMVFQSYAIWPHKTVFQNVAFPLRMQRLPKAEIRERVEQTLEVVGLADFGSRGASLLSGGQMQRVALARSLVMRPQVLLLDEPLSNLDAKLRDRLRFELKEIQQGVGVTSIYVTHDQSEALALADRIAVMGEGEIIQLDDPVGIYRNPGTAFVADFLGMANLFGGEVVPGGEHARRRVRLRDADLEIEADPATAIDGDVSVCARPDVVHVGADRPDGPNVWEGVVQVASFLGSHVRYRVRVADDLTFEAACPARANPFGRGDRVFVHIDPSDVQLLRD